MKPSQALCLEATLGYQSSCVCPAEEGAGALTAGVLKQPFTSLISSVLQIRVDWIFSLPLHCKPYSTFILRKLSSLSCRID
ncbi:hypothetical protein I79_004021 [Cricetulus griseus]|uniref:Uncharacterized protein n=1 Tax=Cricetulus griseus TaxID=10029 RepID=G3H1J3_CRIGR|nr:hypothetical protein I79_004021 [Cricetulus griseus]